MEPPECPPLPPELANLLHIAIPVCSFQFFTNLVCILPNKKGLRAEVDNMAKAPETSSKALPLCHVWVKIPKNEVNASVVIGRVISHKESNAPSDLVVGKQLKQGIGHVLA
jgi:hypothetical protein